MVMVQGLSLSNTAERTQTASGTRTIRGLTASTASDVKTKTMELLQEYKHNPSPALRNRLVEMNLGLVRKEAHRWKRQCQESFEDLLQVGSIGLIQSIERFDTTRGIAFSSFAMPYIRGEIQHYLRDKSQTVRIPRKWTSLIHLSKKMSAQLRQDLGRAATSEELRQSDVSFAGGMERISGSSAKYDHHQPRYSFEPKGGKWQLPGGHDSRL